MSEKEKNVNFKTSKLRVCVCTAATKNLDWQYSITNKLKEEYCKFHGYDFIFRELGEKKTDESYYYRINFLKEMMDLYDLVMWMDADAWFNDFSVDLESFFKDDKIHMVIARDHYEYDRPKRYEEAYINSGIILLKSDAVGKKLVELWGNPNDSAKKWLNTRNTLHDQGFLSCRILWDSYFLDKVLILEPKDLNWFVMFDDYKDKFILHAAGCLTLTKRSLFMSSISYSYEKNSIPFTFSVDKESDDDQNSMRLPSGRKISAAVQRRFDNFIPNGFDITPTLRRQ